jgi:hypothetical protein
MLKVFWIVFVRDGEKTSYLLGHLLYDRAKGQL